MNGFQRQIAYILCVLLCVSQAVAQRPSQKEQLRIQIWAELDAFPGSFDADAPSAQEPPVVWQDEASDAYAAEKRALYGYALARAKELAPFLLSGMIDGWTFDYVPYDKTRRVAEEFTMEEVQAFNASVNPIQFRNPQLEEDRLLCWAYCDRTETQQLAYRRWASIVHPRVQGQGKSSVENGFDGIKAACEQAVKNAVREYWRIYSKNKPKEITGRVLLIGSPRVYISEGQYVVDLEFFLETDRIVMYNYY